MERSVKSKMAERSLAKLASKLSEIELLDLDTMRCVRGGDGEGGGDIILTPPPPG